MKKVSFVLVIIGALNWGLVGIGNFLGSNLNLVDLLIGSWSMPLANIVYILVGLAAVVYLIPAKSSSPASVQQGPQQTTQM